MSTRGQYGLSRRGSPRDACARPARSRASVGACLLNVFELKQRYERASTAPVQALLGALATEGNVSATGPNRWEIGLRDGAWVRLVWDADGRILTITVTDKQPRPPEQAVAARAWYAAILDRLITPRVTAFGAVVAGSVPRDWIGITLYHSVGDRADAVKQLDLDWTALYQDLAVQAGELTRDPKASSGVHYTSQIEFDAQKPNPVLVTWWKVFAKPRFKEWSKFRSAQLGQDSTVAADYIAFAERWQTNWDVYEDWKKKLDALREAAKQVGFKIGAPTATTLPETVWAKAENVIEKGAGDVASGVGDAFKFLKYGAWAVLGIGAVVALSSVASNLRSGKDPAEKYVGLIRDRKRAAKRMLPAALPPPARLALAAGSEG